MTDGIENATPRPWRITTCLDYWIEHNEPRTNVKDDDFQGIALCGDIDWPNYEDRQDEWAANAALIVAAVNSYDEARALLREAADMLDEISDLKDTDEIVARIRAAIGENDDPR